MKKKPSERIGEIVKEIIYEEWVAWAGNKYSLDSWERFCAESDFKRQGLLSKAIIKYLDEKLLKEET